jgi:anaerobic ribonucleoside-triphosphate reductase activating protein
MLIHSIHTSKVNGPGKRLVIWTQGCTKACKNCFNPNTWKFSGLDILFIDIFNKIRALDIDEITISGLDPLEQADILDLLILLYNLNLPKGIILFSGFTLDEINNSSLKECLNYIDVLIDGRYIDEQKISSGLKGSDNQNIIYFSDKIKPEELSIDQEIEIGDGYISGFPYIDKKYLREMGIKLL